MGDFVLFIYNFFLLDHLCVAIHIIIEILTFKFGRLIVFLYDRAHCQGGNDAYQLQWLHYNCLLMWTVTTGSVEFCSGFWYDWPQAIFYNYYFGRFTHCLHVCLSLLVRIYISEWHTVVNFAIVLSHLPLQVPLPFLYYCAVPPGEFCILGDIVKTFTKALSPHTVFRIDLASNDCATKKWKKIPSSQPHTNAQGPGDTQLAIVEAN